MILSIVSIRAVGLALLMLEMLDTVSATFGVWFSLLAAAATGAVVVTSLGVSVVHLENVTTFQTHGNGRRH